MHRLIHNRSINDIGILATIFSAFFILIFALLIIINEYNNFLEQMAQEEKRYLASQKQIIKQETERALKFIRYKYDKYEGMPTEALKKTIVDAIEYMRNERDGTGYIFIYTFDGVNIADPILKQNAGKNLLDFTDPNGKKVIAELIEVSKHKEGGYVEYVWNKPIVNRLAPKISYAKAFKPWNWMVGTGVYLDTIEAELEKKKARYRDRIIGFMTQVAIVAMILLFLVLLFSRYIQDIIKNELTLFRNFFDKASHEYETIDRKQLSFIEFKELSGFANEMVREIQAKNSALEEMNATLEEKVRQKTLSLQEKNEKLRKANDKNKKLIKEQDIFIKNTIHEVNTPLAIILTNIDMARMKNLANKYLTNIESASKVIANLYNDLSFFIRKDRIEYKKAPLDISKSVRDRIDFFDDVATGNELAFNPEITDGLVIYFNRTELERIIDNILSNAIKYSYPDTVIRVSLEKEKDAAKFSVANEGDPIQDAANIFKRFYRENENRGGFGIGLSMVSEICKKNGIKVSVQSEDGVNTFMFTFPLAKEGDA